MFLKYQSPYYQILSFHKVQLKDQLFPTFLLSHVYLKDQKKNIESVSILNKPAK